MTTWDLGDVIPLSIEIRDSAGDLADATTVVLTVTEPDGDTTTPAVSNPSTGVYSASYTPATAGRYSVRWVATGTNASATTDAFTVLDPNYVPVVSLAEARRHLNLSSTTDDEELRRMIDVVTDIGIKHTGRMFGRRTITAEKHDGGRRSIVLRYPPALSITTVTEDGETLTSADYALSPTGSGVLTRVSSGVPIMWSPEELQTVSVTYVSGYELQPAGDVQGALEMLRHLWKTQRGSGGRNLDQGDPSQFWSVPRRVAELWGADVIPGIA